MRVAVRVIGLCLGLLMLLGTTFYPCAPSPQCVSLNASSGDALVDCLLWLVGAAFALGRPRVSMCCFAIAAVHSIAVGLGFFLGATIDETANLILVVPSVLLALLSYLGVRELEAKRAERVGQG